MNVPLAQVLLGLNWLPLLVVILCTAFILGVTSLILFSFLHGKRRAHQLAIAALVIGVASVLTFLLVFGTQMSLVGYVVLFAPLAPAALAIVIIRSSAAPTADDADKNIPAPPAEVSLPTPRPKPPAARRNLIALGFIVVGFPVFLIALFAAELGLFMLSGKF